MGVKKVDIEIPRLDFQVISLGIKENGELVQLGNDDLLFMTVSLNSGDETYKFQKSLSNGITYDNELKKYLIEIDSSDTKNMQEGILYGYDITIYYDRNKPRQKVVGTFKIGKKYTVNEVS